MIKDKLREQKKKIEIMILGALYQDPDSFGEITIKAENFDAGRVFFDVFEIGFKKGLKKFSNDDISILLRENEYLVDSFNSAGGFPILDKIKTKSDKVNLIVYQESLIKADILISLSEFGMFSDEEILEFGKLPIQKIEQKAQAKMSEAFVGISDDGFDKPVDILHDIEKNMMEADEGKRVGIPYSCKYLTKKLNGRELGTTTFFFAKSGSGKSYFTTFQVLMADMELGRPLLILANEEGLGKWQALIVAYIINRDLGLEALGEPFLRERLNEGSWNEGERMAVLEAVKRLKSMIDEKKIFFVDIASYSTAKASRIITKHLAQHDCDQFVIDTFKTDYDLDPRSPGWQNLSNNARHLRDLAKKMNIHIFFTGQAAKTQTERKFMNEQAVAGGKDLIDTCDKVMGMRPATQDEKAGNPGSLSVVDENGFVVYMEPDKHYIIIFFVKNRANDNTRQLVYELDMGSAKMKYFGTTQISEDW